MFQGEVRAIYLRPGRAEPTVSVQNVDAVPGRGLQGDHRFSPDPRAPQVPAKTELTLIEIEAIEAVGRDYALALRPDETRRNLLTRGVPLNQLVGREFEIGEVRCRGLQLCEPCDHLEGLTRPGIKKALLHRGGLRAQILSEGEIRVGDAVRPAAPRD